ncbi:MAG: TolC family protein, partial [Proteobacteria bacterium]|nr:TolC family protein [Pseudomonadota bacterium]
EMLRSKAWHLSIAWQQKDQEIAILKNHLLWLKQQLTLSQALYAAGQSSQVILLSLKSEITKRELDLKLKTTDQDLLHDELRYLFNQSFFFHPEDNMYAWLCHDSGKGQQGYQHPKEQALKSHLRAQKYDRLTKARERIPDIHFSLGSAFPVHQTSDHVSPITMMVGFQWSIPLARFPAYDSSVQKELSAHMKLHDFQRQRETKLIQLNKKKQILAEIRARYSDTLIPEAEARKKSVVVSFGLKNTDYRELLAAEISLLQVLEQEAVVSADLLKVCVDLKYQLGEPLS